MSFTFRTQGIVLSMRDHLEADRFYSVLTDEHGKLELRARGSRKPLSKLSPDLEPFALCDLMIVRGRYGDIVAGVERLQSFNRIREDADKMLLALQTLHLLDIGTRPHVQDASLFDELKQWLGFLHEASTFTAERSAFLSAGFTLKLLALLGYRPELSRCVSCQKTIEPMGYAWHGLRGGVVCRACMQREPEQWFAARPVQDNTLKLVRFAMSEKFDDLLQLRLPGHLVPEFHDLVESLVIAHFPVIPTSTLRSAALA